MAWMLCRAELCCVARRLEAAFEANPLVVGAGALGLAALPALALWSGVRVAPELRAAAAQPSFGLSIGLAAAVTGALVTLLAPASRALGSQLEAAPLSRLTVFAGLTALPLGLLLCAFALPAALFVTPAAGGRTPFVLGRLLGAAALGGAAAEAALALARRSLLGVPVAAGVGLIALALRDVSPLAVPLWLAAAAARPDEPAERGSVRVLACTPFGSALARYVRRRELRRQVLAALALTAVGALVLRLTGVPRAAGALLAGSTALLGAAVVPLAATGLDRPGAWLWRASPASRARVAARNEAAALVAGACVAAAGFGVALALEPVPPVTLAPLAAAALVVLGAALLAGALVPWRSERLAEQLGAYAAFAAVLTALWLALAHAAPLVRAEHGARAGALAAVTLVCCVGAATALSVRPA